MKKSILTIITLVAIVMCGCEQNPNNPSGNNTSGSSVDISPYLGKYLMSRHTELSINVLGMFSFPLDKDLDVELFICAVLSIPPASIFKTTRSLS